MLRMIDAFKVFDVIYITTGGGPADVAKTVSFHVYRESFSYLRVGSGAAYAVLVAFVLQKSLITGLALGGVKG